MAIVWDVRIIILSALLAVSMTDGAFQDGRFQEGRRMMQLTSQTSTVLPLISLGGTLCTKGTNVAASMRVQCVSLNGQVTHITCLRMCQATEDSCALCDDANDACRRGAGVSDPNINFTVNSLGLYQDSGCQIIGGGTNRQRQSFAPSPAQINATSVLDFFISNGTLNANSARSKTLVP